jgi:hypothetical protein
MTETTKRRVALDLSTLSVEERAHITAYVNHHAFDEGVTPAYVSQRVSRDPELLAEAIQFPIPVEMPPVPAEPPTAVAAVEAPLTPGPAPRRTRARGETESPR